MPYHVDLLDVQIPKTSSLPECTAEDLDDLEKPNSKNLFINVAAV